MSDDSQPVALVTGSATGVGRACVLEFAKRGYAVVINYSRSEAEAMQTAKDVQSLGAKSLVVCADVSSDQQVREMSKKIEATFGRLDVLVNNAATTSFIPHDDLEGLTEEMWDRMLAVNLKGAFFVTRAVADLLQAGDGGSVVNVSSIAGIVGSGSSIAYCTTKAGLNVMTKSLARVMAPKVRVNSVCPDRSIVAGFAKAIPIGIWRQWSLTIQFPRHHSPRMSQMRCCSLQLTQPW